MIPNELVFTKLTKAFPEPDDYPADCFVLIKDRHFGPHPIVLRVQFINSRFFNSEDKEVHLSLIEGVCPIYKKAFDVEKCTIAELSSARRNLENELREIICKSGLPISNVSVNLHEGTTVSDTARRYFCSGVDIELSV